MSSKDKRDYFALQRGWMELEHLYNHAYTIEEKVRITDDYIDSLVDSGMGKMALFSTYSEWEKNEWFPLINKKFEEWKHYNFYASENTEGNEYNQIKQERNYLRYRQIRQIIQDSGIGFGDKSGVRHFTAQGYDGN